MAKKEFFSFAPNSKKATELGHQDPSGSGCAPGLLPEDFRERLQHDPCDPCEDKTDSVIMCQTYGACPYATLVFRKGPTSISACFCASALKGDELSECRYHFHPLRFLHFCMSDKHRHAISRRAMFILCRYKSGKGRTKHGRHLNVSNEENGGCLAPERPEVVRRQEVASK